MDLLPIGEVARRFGVNSSALRYYEERGIVRPAARRGGKRMYGPEGLRRLAFSQITQRLGMSLDAAAAILDGPAERWRDVLGAQIGALDDLIARARDARDFLQHALDCPAAHPIRECEVLIGGLDRRAAGESLDRLVADHRREHLRWHGAG
jgi:DNA-binding transcriptional MerR regulator